MKKTGRAKISSFYPKVSNFKQFFLDFGKPHTEQVIWDEWNKKIQLFVRSNGLYERSLRRFSIQVSCMVISREIRPLAALDSSPPPAIQKSALKGCNIKLRSRFLLSVVAGGGMLMPTAFEPFSIVSVYKNILVWGGGIRLLGSDFKGHCQFY